MNQSSTILLVDDESEIIEIVSGILKGLNCQILTAFNGKDALDIIRKFRPNVVVSDIAMPKMDGLEMLASLVEVGDTTPVVFISAYGDQERRLKAWQLGAFEFLDKPFEEKAVVETVKRALEEGAQLKQAPPVGRITKGQWQNLYLQLDKQVFETLKAKSLIKGQSVRSYLNSIIDEHLKAEAEKKTKRSA